MYMKITATLFPVVLGNGLTYWTDYFNMEDEFFAQFEDRDDLQQWLEKEEFGNEYIILKGAHQGESRRGTDERARSYFGSTQIKCELVQQGLEYDICMLKSTVEKTNRDLQRGTN